MKPGRIVSLSLGSTKHYITSGRVTGEVQNPERPPGPLRAPPHVGHISGHIVEEPPTPALPQVRYVCYLYGIERESSGHRDVHQGGRS